MQLVIKNAKIIAFHPDHVKVPEEVYPGAEVVNYSGKALKVGDPDPRGKLSKETIVESVRQKRAALLSATDWTQLLDTPLDVAERLQWATYRQALRDLPEQIGNKKLTEIQWPIPPGKIKPSQVEK